MFATPAYAQAAGAAPVGGPQDMLIQFLPLIGLVVLFYFINLIAQKIPLRPLFIVTSAFLFAMAIKFIGEAVQEFQEQAILPVTELKGTAWLGAIGLNSSLEALSIQLLVILFALATYSVFQRNARLAREDKAAMKGAKG